MSYRFVATLALLFTLLSWTSGCTTLATSSETPSYARTSAHYVAFADADALAAYLRYGSEAGPLVSAHRGGPMPAYPENALATFEHTLRYAPVLIECDVRLSRDSVLVMMHDDTLDRTTTGTGPVSEHTLAELRSLLLEDEYGIITPFRIPTLAETLAWAEHRAILTLDVKQDVSPRQVVALVRQMHAEDRVVIIVYTLDDLLRYHALAPDLNISASASTQEEAHAVLTSGVDLSRVIVFTGVGDVNRGVIDMLHARGIRAMLGTFDLIDGRARQAGATVYEALFGQGVDVIATDVVPLAAEAAKARRLGD